MIYHVAPADHTGNLESLYVQRGDEAYDLYATRWPEAGELAQYHAHYIHCFDTLDQARDHAVAFGGKIYEIDDEDLEVERDTLEFDHPMIKGEIDAECIKVVA